MENSPKRRKKTYSSKSISTPSQNVSNTALQPETVDIYYVGNFQSAGRIGLSGKEYSFTKDIYGAPLVTKVLKKDVKGLIQEQGKGCFRRNPEKVFVLKSDYDKAIEEDKAMNRF
jgi:hypothetical protein